MPSLAAANIAVTAACSPERRSARVRTAAAAGSGNATTEVSSSSIDRRGALVGFGACVLGAVSPANAAVRLFPTDLDPRRRFFQNLVEPWEPYFGWGERVTVRRELVPGSIWSLEQEQALDVLAMNIRTTVVKLKSTGSLVVFSPQAPTREFFELLDELGVVEHVVLPTYALEHKVWLPPLSRRYPRAKVWVTEGIWSVPVDLPLEWLGIEKTGTLTVNRGGLPDDAERTPSWLDELDYRVLRVDTAGANPYIETCFYHRESRSLLVTDLVLSIPTYPPEVISRDRLLNLAPDDPADAPAAPTDENLMIGWAKASLVVSFLGPSRQSQVEDGEFKGKLKWEPGYEKSFESIRERTIPSPILRTLVFSKGRGFTRDFINVLCRDWGDEDTGFVQIIPAHYDAPIAASPADLRRAFAFIDQPGTDGLGLDAPGAELPEEDMKLLRQVNDVLVKVGLGS